MRILLVDKNKCNTISLHKSKNEPIKTVLYRGDLIYKLNLREILLNQRQRSENEFGFKNPATTSTLANPRLEEKKIVKR
jgi:hypothetical protein